MHNVSLKEAAATIKPPNVMPSNYQNAAIQQSVISKSTNSLTPVITKNNAHKRPIQNALSVQSSQSTISGTSQKAGTSLQMISTRAYSQALKSVKKKAVTNSASRRISPQAPHELTFTRLLNATTMNFRPNAVQMSPQPPALGFHPILARFNWPQPTTITRLLATEDIQIYAAINKFLSAANIKI